MEIITAIVGRSAGFLIAPVAQQLGYVISYKSNVEKLKHEVQKLTTDRTDKQRIVEDAKRNHQEVTVAVQDWFNRVEATIAVANKLINEDHGEVRCLHWPFPNLFLRLKLSKEAEEVAQKVTELVAEGMSQTISYRARTYMTIPPAARGYEALKSRTSALNEIKQALKDPNIYMIGVYGMAGVGKTTLVEELAWQAEKDGSFDVVIKAIVTSTPDLRRIQGQLADGLDLKLEKETEQGRAGELRGRISGEKSILVILDDIWSELDLAELGVPFGDEYSERFYS